jgi:hypothetical protein
MYLSIAANSGDFDRKGFELVARLVGLSCIVVIVQWPV